MKILVTGSQGMLGYDLGRVLSGEHQVISTDIDNLDITNLDQTLAIIRNINPDTVIHAAADTNVDGCESNIDLAFQVNGLGARNVAIACQETGASMTYFSSDYVFNGEKGSPYLEYDLTNPISIYGQSKLWGEMLVKEVLPRHRIIRTSWLFGSNGKNFVTTMLDLAKKTPELRVVNDQIGSPTYTLDLARAISQMLAKPLWGTFHLTNSDTCSWYDFAVEIFALSGMKVNINPICSDELIRPAPRPQYSVLENYMWKLEGYTPLRSYKNALAEFMGVK